MPTTTHIRSAAARVVLVAAGSFASLVALTLAGAIGSDPEAAFATTPSAVSTAIAGGYGWPVKPFHQEHPVRGNLGDPRTVFLTPPTPESVLVGGGSFSFHQGVDISAPNGTAAYPVR